MTGLAEQQDARRQETYTRKRHKATRLADISLVLQQVHQERLCQLRKWGIQDHDPKTWLAILTEEVGEVARCLCPSETFDAEHYRKELIQVAAVAAAAIEAIDNQ